MADVFFFITVNVDLRLIYGLSIFECDVATSPIKCPVDSGVISK